MSLASWVGRQLADPVKLYHGTGWAMLVAEVMQSFWTGHTVDMNVVYVGFGLIAGGIAQDRFNTPPTTPPKA